MRSAWVKSALKKVGRTGWRVVRALDREFNIPESSWLRRDEKTKVFIFVHGLLSEAPRAWSGGGTSWQELMLNDDDFADWDIVVANWYSTVMSEEHSIEVEAERLYQYLFVGEEGISGDSKKEVVFLCHSLGGILVRQMLVAHPHLVHDFRVGCITLGTPARGAKLATILSSLSKLFKHTQAQALVFDSPTLLRIHEEFFRLVRESSGRLFGKELYESSGLGKNLRVVKSAGRFGLRIPPLVGLDSQGGYFGDPLEVEDTDHASISRPLNREAASYRSVKSTLGVASA
jgi:triacylglycerol esterase/lipase EstA (alpha/beta hydrolase family)